MSILRNRTVWVFGIAALLAAPGCVVGDGGGDTSFVAHWSLLYVGADTGPSCEQAGTPTVELTMTNRQTGTKSIDSFACSSFGGQSRNLPPGSYDVHIALKNQAGKEISVQDGPFDLVRHSLTDLNRVDFQIQSFHLAWSLARGSTSVACQDVGATTVNVITRLNSEPEVIYSFPCRDGAGDSPAILIGTYSVAIQLLGSNNQVLWVTDAPMTVPVDGNVRADLGVVRFDLK